MSIMVTVVLNNLTMWYTPSCTCRSYWMSS